MLKFRSQEIEIDILLYFNYFVTFTVRLRLGTSFDPGEIKLSHFSGYNLYTLIISSLPTVIDISCRVRICNKIIEISDSYHPAY